MHINKTSHQPVSISWPPFALGILLIFICFVLVNIPKQISAQDSLYEIYVHAGQIEDSIEYLESINYWNEKSHHEEQDAPRIILVASSKHWVARSKNLPVEVKKELFYRTITPMVLYANELILDDRQELEEVYKKLKIK